MYQNRTRDKFEPLPEIARKSIEIGMSVSKDD